MSTWPSASAPFLQGRLGARAWVLNFESVGGQSDLPVVFDLRRFPVDEFPISCHPFGKSKEGEG